MTLYHPELSIQTTSPLSPQHLLYDGLLVNAYRINCHLQRNLGLTIQPVLQLRKKIKRIKPDATLN